MQVVRANTDPQPGENYGSQPAIRSHQVLPTHVGFDFRNKTAVTWMYVFLLWRILSSIIENFCSALVNLLVSVGTIQPVITLHI